MANALRQSNNGGSGSGTTSAVGYSSNTAAGSLLVCVIRASYNDSTNDVLSISAPSTSGFTWTAGGSGSWDAIISTSPLRLKGGAVRIYYIANASIMSTSVTTTVTATVGGTTPSVSFELYEFTGVVTSSPVD